MRTYLNCPFAEKDEAKSLGARWDGAKKRWYIEDAKDLGPFARWLAQDGAAPASAKARVDASPGVRTGPKEVPHCGCDALPWESCVHTPAARAER
ncbi:DUF5710 domain-containing protein [Ramlibacter sp.]|uniref:DUF5710 domain-containing protein n=1 Tax=Ramlibacter sp. TaxID=1917967 RepID=UPI0026079B32|nr:DUF5710 domain-containing protein [Ramlibacter sp.]MDB5958339.1 hypothetical protein [Ramlibacter sp.]